MFDIHQTIWDENGEVDFDRVGDYTHGLMEEFAESPEAQPIIEEFGSVGWSASMMDYAVNYFGVTPPKMSPADLHEIVFEIFPRKVSAEPESAEEIIAELRAFWSFLDRQHGLRTAPKMLGLLDDQAASRLQKELGDPSNFGMAKSLVMLGTKAGYDMTTQAGLNEFMLAYSSSLLLNRGSDLSMPAAPDYPPPMLRADRSLLPTGPYLPPSPLSRKEREEKRKKRKQQRQARKRNRR